LTANGADAVKKKGHHQPIPDFSAKKPGAPAADPQNPKVKGFRPAPIPGGKPHSTSKKSGRRGA